jgi:hypothetical protein
VEFLHPKQKLGSKVEWFVSNRTKSIVKYYAEYASVTEDEAVDHFLLNILKNDQFINWAKKKRRNARIMKQLFPEDNAEVENGERT